MKKFLMYSCIGFVVAVLTLVVSAKIFATSCDCVDEDMIETECLEGEYTGYLILSSNCDYNACNTRVRVYCWDKDENESYSRDTNSFVIDCSDCTGGSSGGGDDWENPIWW